MWKLHKMKPFLSVLFDKFWEICLSNHFHNQDIEQFYYPQRLSPFPDSSSLISDYSQTWIRFVFSRVSRN